jgi:hypothetical protein
MSSAMVEGEREGKRVERKLYYDNQHNDREAKEDGIIPSYITETRAWPPVGVFLS